MKRALSLLLIALPVIPLAGCSSEEGGPEYPGGGTGTTGGVTTGGSASGSDTGGMVTTAGTVGTSGTATGGASGGTGGASGGTGGASGGTGGASGGTGGVSGGTGGASGGTGGVSGGTGGTGGSAEMPVSVGKLDGMLIQTPCNTSDTDDCNSGGWIYEGKTYACSGGNLDTDAAATRTILDFPVTGVPGKVYVATMRFYGIMEPKNYGDGIQREAMTRPGLGNPSNPPGFAWGKTANPNVRASDYNTYEIHIVDDKGAVIKRYYLNADTQEGHWTFAIDYEREIEIIGGGKVHIRSFDSNCRMIKNCGSTGAGMPCGGKAQSIMGVSAASPAIAVSQPGLGRANDQAGQWFAIDVKTIVPKP